MSPRCAPTARAMPSSRFRSAASITKMSAMSRMPGQDRERPEQQEDARELVTDAVGQLDAISLDVVVVEPALLAQVAERIEHFLRVPFARDRAALVRDEYVVDVPLLAQSACRSASRMTDTGSRNWWLRPRRTPPRRAPSRVSPRRTGQSGRRVQRRRSSAASALRYSSFCPIAPRSSSSPSASK